MKKYFLKLIKPSIVFESIPNFSDNTRAVYDELVARGYGKKYRLIWFLEWNKCASIENGVKKYWNPWDRKTIPQIIRNYSFFNKTKCIICCNRFLPSQGEGQVTHGENQKSFYLTHGIPMKSVKSYYTSPGGVDYILSPGKAVDQLMAYEFSFNMSQVFTAGFPRNDVLTKPVDVKKRLGLSNQKIIIWYPTYRQKKDHKVVTTQNALPIIHDEENAKKLNEVAKNLGILLILKPHFAQDTSMIRDLRLSNIRLINDDFFTEKDLSSYELLAGSDALITDYSSVYFDYTLCDKPIGVIWEDIDEYRSFPGFAMDLDYYLKGAEKIYTLEELSMFLSDVAAGNDRLQAERREIRDAVNFSADGKSTKRVVDFIVEKAGL